MADVRIHKVKDQDLNALPIKGLLEYVRHRAFELFERRGSECGHEIEDWLQAEREVLGSRAAEMTENDKKYEFQIALAGFDTKEVEVTAKPSEITVHAQTKSEKETEESNVVGREFGSKDVYRRFEIAQPINVDKTTATLDKGILRITAPKAGANVKPMVAAAA
jgi:HSP20 family protein